LKPAEKRVSFYLWGEEMSDIYGWQDYIYNYTKRTSVYNSTSNPSSAMYDEALAQVQSIGNTFSDIPENKTAP